MFLGVAFLAMTTTSCGTLFTSSKQDITFVGKPGTAIYDKGKRISEIQQDGIGSAQIKKKLSSKTLIAKKDGYTDTPFKLDATFNPISVLNLTNPIAWVIDLGTGKCCKWDEDIIEIILNPLPISANTDSISTPKNIQ